MFIEDLHYYIDEETGCWEWLYSKNKKGYGLIPFNNKTTIAHRLMYSLVKGEIGDGMCVCHSCDNPSCVNPDHLWRGTNKENSRDREEKGRSNQPDNSGSKHGMSKLNEDDVVNIRIYAGSGILHKDIADIYGVSKSVISMIVNRKRWKHVK